MSEKSQRLGIIIFVNLLTIFVVLPVICFSLWFLFHDWRVAVLISLMFGIFLQLFEIKLALMGMWIRRDVDREEIQG